MKKIISLILVAMFLVACLASCSTANKSGTDTTAAPSGDAAKAKLTMATNPNFPPYEYVEGGKIIGIDAEIAEKIAEKLDMELEIVETEFGSIIGGVQTGKYDMGMAGMTVTEKRLESVNFTNSYATGIQAVIVPIDSEYASFEDFYTEFDADGKPVAVKDGISIGVQEDTTGDIYCSDEPANWGFGSDHVVSYKNSADAVQALITGKHTAVIVDKAPAESFVAQNSDKIKILESAYTEEQYAICLAKENTELLEKINKALAELTADGTVAAIIEKYIPSK